MAPVFTRRLFMGLITQQNGYVAYTAPADKSVVIRDLVWLSLTASGVLNISIASAGKTGILVYAATVTGATVHQDLRQVLNPGDQLRVSITGSDVYLMVTGYVFELA